MARNPPFSVEDQNELGPIASILFSGGALPESSRGAAEKWATAIRMFLMAVNRENGTLVHLPESGGLLDQPKRTMDIMLFLQNIFIRCIQKKMKQGSKG